MTAHAAIIGEEVIGQPGQHLSSQELRVLVGLADGIPTNTVAKDMALDAVGMRHVESNIMAKLGARNKVHMITRGFTLGVLIPQALCLLICVAAVLESHSEFNRNGRQRRDRNLAEHSRSLRNATSPAGGPPLRAAVA